MAHALALILALSFGAMAAPPKAAASVCQAIRPTQQLPAETDQAVKAAVQAGVKGVVDASISGEGSNTASYAVRLLSDDALARSWYTYQLCVLKDSGVITPAMHEELMRSVWGLTSPSATTGAPAAGSPTASTAATPSSAQTATPSATSPPSMTAGSAAAPAQQLQQAVAAPAVAAQLAGPDGAGVDLSDANNWKVFAVGTAPLMTDDAFSQQEATTEATLAAKAALSRFFSERVTTDSSIETLTTMLVSTGAGPSGPTNSATRDTAKRQLTAIRSSADAILRGVVVLQVEHTWDGKSGMIRIKVGQSQKTLSVADLLQSHGAATPLTPTTAPATGTQSPTTDF